MLEFKLSDYEHFKKCWPLIRDGLLKGFDGGKDLLLILQRPRRNSISNAKLHAIIGEIRSQCVIKIGVHTLDKSRNIEVWKSLLVRWFDLELIEIGEPLKKGGIRIFDMMYGEWVYMRPSTTDFDQDEACKFIDWLYCFGSERGVKWSEKATNIYSEYIN